MWFALCVQPVVQIPRAEDDPALSAAVGVDGMQSRAHFLVKRSLSRQQRRGGVNMVDNAGVAFSKTKFLDICPQTVFIKVHKQQNPSKTRCISYKAVTFLTGADARLSLILEHPNQS